MKNIERKLIGFLYSRFYPELDRIEDEEDRVRVSMVAGLLEPNPPWSCRLLVLLFFVFPIIGGFSSVVVSASLGVSDRYFIFIYFGGVMIGLIVPVTIIFLVQRRKTRRLHIQTMHNLGYEMCPVCGYDLTGNESGACPECGAKAPT